MRKNYVRDRLASDHLNREFTNILGKHILGKHSLAQERLSSLFTVNSETNNGEIKEPKLQTSFIWLYQKDKFSYVYMHM